MPVQGLLPRFEDQDALFYELAHSYHEHESERRREEEFGPGELDRAIEPTAEELLEGEKYTQPPEPTPF